MRRLVPAVDPWYAGKDMRRIGEWFGCLDGERLGEEALAQLVGTADRTHGRVQDRYAIAQTFRLFESMRRQENRHATLPERRDELVDLAGRNRVQACRRLVEE